MVYINRVLINSNLWRSLMMCITLIDGLVLINAYIGINHRLQNLLMNLASYANIDLSYANLHKLSLHNSDYSCLFIVCLFVYYIYLILYGLKYFFFKAIVFFQGFLFKAVFSKPQKKRRKKLIIINLNSQLRKYLL